MVADDEGVPRRARHWIRLGFIIMVILALLLKLTAVVLAAAIGELLGKKVSIKYMVGVHKVSIRAIEMILKRPGLNKAKVAILIGGPDWPTSVLTGILGLSLPQMLLEPYRFSS